MVHTERQMNRLRWYSSATMLPNAEVYIQGGTGGADFPERRNSNGTFQLLTGASDQQPVERLPEELGGAERAGLRDRQQPDVRGQPGGERDDQA